jgi:exonuclease VII large subunit
VLARGWSITRKADDQSLVRSPDDVAAGDKIVTTLAAGQITSTAATPGPTPAPTQQDGAPE